LKIESRFRIVQFAYEHGVKPAARQYSCHVRTIRKWLERWIASGFKRQALEDRSRAPKTCPHKTPPHIEAQVIAARQQAPCFGAPRLKDMFDLRASVSAIKRILRVHGLTRRRRKKRDKKRDLRAVKARFEPFAENQVDTKYLTDIPYYVAQLLGDPTLARFLYTWRDVRTGALFLGLANELSKAHACAFAAAVGAHLRRTGFDLAGFGVVQTDNGTEFSGTERTVSDDGFPALIEKRLLATHRFIPPRRKNRQADVETIHHLIEGEFFDLECFAGRDDLLKRASLWQLWFNTARKNYSKGGRTPDDILREERPERDPRVWLLPVLDLDQLVAARAKALASGTSRGGYYLPSLPVLAMNGA